jgi:hypothetical protein
MSNLYILNNTITLFSFSGGCNVFMVVILSFCIVQLRGKRSSVFKRHFKEVCYLETMKIISVHSLYLSYELSPFKLVAEKVSFNIKVRIFVFIIIKEIVHTQTHTHTHTYIYCNKFAGSISRWKFITLRIQYTIVNYNQQRF